MADSSRRSRSTVPGIRAPGNRARPCRGRRSALIYNQMVVDLLADDARADLVFNALADPTRRDIVRRAMRGEHSVSDLAGNYAMSFAAVQKHAEALTMKITSEYDAPVERCWQLWADPRQLERWWGPPTYPATFVDHELSTGGGATYYMTGPEG